MAVAHSILVIVYHLLRDATTFHDLGPTYFEPRDTLRAARKHVRRLEQLGFTVTFAQPAA